MTNIVVILFAVSQPILEHRDKRIRSNQQNPTLIVDQTFFTDENSRTNSTREIGNYNNLFNIKNIQ